MIVFEEGVSSCRPSQPDFLQCGMCWNQLKMPTNHDPIQLSEPSASETLPCKLGSSPPTVLRTSVTAASRPCNHLENAQRLTVSNLRAHCDDLAIQLQVVRRGSSVVSSEESYNVHVAQSTALAPYFHHPWKKARCLFKGLGRQETRSKSNCAL